MAFPIAHVKNLCHYRHCMPAGRRRPHRPILPLYRHLARSFQYGPVRSDLPSLQTSDTADALIVIFDALGAPLVLMVQCSNFDVLIAP